MQSSSCSGKWSLPVMLILDLSLTRVVHHSPFPVLCLAYTRVVDGAVWAYAHAHDDHYLTRSRFNSLLTEMITPQTYNIIYLLLSCHVTRLNMWLALSESHGSWAVSILLVVMKIICAGRAFAKVTRFLWKHTCTGMHTHMGLVPQ